MTPARVRRHKQIGTSKANVFGQLDFETSGHIAQPFDALCVFKCIDTTHTHAYIDRTNHTLIFNTECTLCLVPYPHAHPLNHHHPPTHPFLLLPASAAAMQHLPCSEVITASARPRRSWYDIKFKWYVSVDCFSNDLVISRERRNMLMSLFCRRPSNSACNFCSRSVHATAIINHHVTSPT
jgi:hypothetical protein